jgi:hypothetical protein
MPLDFLLTSGTLSNGRTVHYAQRANSTESKFVIGYPTTYDGNKTGLYNLGSASPALIYRHEDYSAQYGFWAVFLYPTAMAESKGSYIVLNTYDRAQFTFTFMQFAAHVPNGDFVDFFKQLLALPNASEYFPRLVVQNKRIFYKNANKTLKQLEDDDSTQELMNYLNPSLNEIENQELICAARMVHWAMNDPQHRALQVRSAIDLYRENMVNYDKRFSLDGAPAKVCLVICDIRHQGRGKNDRIATALSTNGDWEKAYNNLLTIGEANYKGRIDTLKKTIASLEKAGLFNKKWNREKKAFVG